MIPLLAVPQPVTDHVTVLVDPGSEGLQLHSMTLPFGTYPEDVLADAQRRAGMVVYINGMPAPVHRRALVTGDYVQILHNTRYTSVTRHFGPLLEAMHELRLFSVPMYLPALHLVGGTAVQNIHLLNSHRRFTEFFDYALAARTEAVGTPHAERRVVWILQQGRAPHRLWLDTPLTPGIQQATQLLQGTGLFEEPFELFDAGSTAQTTAAAIFLALPPRATYWTFVVSDPIAALSYGMIHLAPGSVVNLEAIPAPEGMTYRSPATICQGAHFMLCSRERVLAERPPSEASSSGPRRRPPADDSGTNPDPDIGASSGTSLVQLSLPSAARRQIIFDSAPSGSPLHGQACLSIPAPPMQLPCEDPAVRGVATARSSVPTPFGRRMLPAAPSIAPSPTGRLGSPASLVPGSEMEAVPSVAPVPSPTAKVSVSIAACLEARGPASDPADGVLRIGLPLDARSLALSGFDVCHYCRQKPSASDIHPAAQRFLDTIESAGHAEEPVALMFYLDGSFAGQTASFAVVCLGLFADQWKWIGYLADVVSEPIQVSSAFEGELFAQLVALGTAATVSVPTTIFYDCQSAACVAGGQSSSGASTLLGRAATGLYICSGVEGRWPTMQHVRSHQGHPINELADWLAKRVLTHVGARAPVGDDKVSSYVGQCAFDWLWLYQASKHAREWPDVDEDGDTIPVVPSPSAAPPTTPAEWALPLTSAPPQCSDFCLRLVSYNTLSCRAALQRQCLSQFMRANAVGVLGLQETRQELLETAQVDGILRFGGPAPDGQLGCQAWFNLSAGPWQRACFRKVFQRARLLEVHARLGDQLLAFLVGHSPTAVAAAPVRDQWWQMLHQRLQAMPPGFQPILLLDANARHCLSNAVEAPNNCNAHALAELMQKHGLQRTAAYEDSGLPRVTWRPPSGVLAAGACLDYILGPASWGSSVVAQGLLPR